MSLNLKTYEAFGDIINRKYDKGLEPIPGTMKVAGFVTVENISNETGDTRRHKERPQSNQYASFKSEGGQATKAQVQVGYSKDTANSTFSESIDITLEWRKLGKNPEIKNAMKDLSEMLPNKEDLDLSMFFSFGTATTYTDKDGRTIDIATGASQSIWNTAHTLTGSADTYRNRLANNPKLSQGALENMERLAVEESLSNLGETIIMDYDILWTGPDPEVVNTAAELLQSTAKISAPNEGVENVYEGKYRHTVLKRATMNANGGYDTSKRYHWGLASSTGASFFHDEYISPMLAGPSDGGKDIETLDWTWTTVGGYGSCVVVGRGLLFSSGDGTA